MGISVSPVDGKYPVEKRLARKKLLVAVLQDVARGAVQGAADGIKRREADGLGLARLED